MNQPQLLLSDGLQKIPVPKRRTSPFCWSARSSKNGVDAHSKKVWWDREVFGGGGKSLFVSFLRHAIMPTLWGSFVSCKSMVVLRGIGPVYY